MDYTFVDADPRLIKQPRHTITKNNLKGWEPYLDEILKMRRNGNTAKEIQKFLECKGETIHIILLKKKLSQLMPKNKSRKAKQSKGKGSNIDSDGLESDDDHHAAGSAEAQNRRCDTRLERTENSSSADPSSSSVANDYDQDTTDNIQIDQTTTGEPRSPPSTGKDYWDIVM